MTVRAAIRGARSGPDVILIKESAVEHPVAHKKRATLETPFCFTVGVSAYSAACACAVSAIYFSASSAAIQPMPAAVTAWR